MGKGKIIAIVGAVIGALSVVLSLVLPELFGWYRSHVSVVGLEAGYYLHGFGIFDTSNSLLLPMPPGVDEMVLLVMIGGILMIAGAVVCALGAFVEKKFLGLLGGLLMIVGPLLLLVDIMTGMSEFIEFLELFNGESGVGLLFGSTSPAPGVTFSWGLWIGFFLAIGGGIVGLIGGATID